MTREQYMLSLAAETQRLKAEMITPTGEEDEARMAEILSHNLTRLEKINKLAIEINQIAAEISGEIK